MAESQQDKNKPLKESVDDASNSFSNESEVVWLDTYPECSVCLQLCLQPVQLPCLHVFCFLCLKGFVFRSKKCALCRSEVKLEYFDKPVIVKVKDCQSPSTPKEEKYDWFYEGRNGWWQYDQRASTILEDAYTSEARSCELNIAGFIYLINFENMVQFRKSHPARCRRIKRDKAGVDRKGIAGLKVKPKTEIDTSEEQGNNVTQKDTLNNKPLSHNSSSNTQSNLTENGSAPRNPQISDTELNGLASELDRTL